MCSVAQSCPIVCNPMDCSLPSSSVRGVSQARRLGWVAISSSRGIFPTKGRNPRLLRLLHWQADSLSLCYLGSRVLKVLFTRKLKIYNYMRWWVCWLVRLQQSFHNEYTYQNITLYTFNYTQFLFVNYNSFKAGGGRKFQLKEYQLTLMLVNAGFCNRR